MSYYLLQKIEGIGRAFGEKLETAEVRSTDDLLERCCDRAGRVRVASATDVSEKLLLRWVNMADLMRIDGIGPQYSELLEAAGVDTVRELGTRRADNLYAKMVEVNEDKRLCRMVPVESVVAGWIEEAKGLTPKITH